MTNQTSGLRLPIAVGVDGSTDAVRAMDFAVQEAKRQHCGLRVVHAAHDARSVTPMLPLLSSETLQGVGRRFVTEAIAEADRMSGGQVETEAVVRTDSAVSALVDSSKDARLVVLGHRKTGGVGRILTHFTTLGVAARARCPVLSVPATWRRDKDFGVVVAGIDGSSASREVLTVAFAAAAARQATLRVVHAWRVPLAYDDVLEPVGAEEERRTQSEPVISEILAGWRTDYPDVPVEIDLRYQRTADALVDASAAADLLVIGRHGQAGRMSGLPGMPLGSIARTLLHHAHCPVEIAPQRKSEREPASAHQAHSSRAEPISAPLY